jgi:hypothetical protein
MSVRPGFNKRRPACRRLYLREADELPWPASFDWRPTELVVGARPVHHPPPVELRERDK